MFRVAKWSVVSVSLIFVLVLGNVQRTNGLIDDVLDIVHIGKEVAAGVLQTWDIIEQTNLGDQIDLPITREKQKKVLRRLRELSRQIETAESKHINTASWTIDSINKYVKANTEIELLLSKIHDMINSITVRFKQMNIYAKHRNKLENSTLINFAEWTVSPNTDAINHLLENLFLYYSGGVDLRSRRPGLLHMMDINLKVGIVLSAMHFRPENYFIGVPPFAAVTNQSLFKKDKKVLALIQHRSKFKETIVKRNNGFGFDHREDLRWTLLIWHHVESMDDTNIFILYASPTTMESPSSQSRSYVLLKKD